VSSGSSENVPDAKNTVKIVVAASPSTPTPTPTSTPTPTPGVEPATPTPGPGTATPVVGGVTAVASPSPSPSPEAVTPTPGLNLSSSDMMNIGGCLAVGLIIAFIILIVLVYLWLKSSLQVLPKKTRIPADGVSKVPVRVQFVNGLGMAKKMSRDTDVDFETTAGTIKSAAVPQGKDYVDSELTSSKEFGPVVVTARAKGKTASAKIDFVLEQGSLEVTVKPEAVPADGVSSATVTVKIKDDKGTYVAPLEDKTINLKSTLGTIAPTLNLPARAQSASTSITSGAVSGTAVIVATIGNMHGEGKVEFKGMPKRFCMHCGAPMSLEASQCPKCSQTPPSGTDVKECPSCSTVIPEAAKYCYHCGARQPESGNKQARYGVGDRLPPDFF